MDYKCETGKNSMICLPKASYVWMKRAGEYETFLVFCAAQSSFLADHTAFLPELPRPVVNRTVGDSEGAQTPWDVHEAACQKGAIRGCWTHRRERAISGNKGQLNGPERFSSPLDTLLPHQLGPKRERLPDSARWHVR